MKEAEEEKELEEEKAKEAEEEKELEEEKMKEKAEHAKVGWNGGFRG